MLLNWRLPLSLSNAVNLFAAVASICFKVCLDGCYREDLCFAECEARMQVWQCILSANTSWVLRVALTLDCSCPAFVILYNPARQRCVLCTQDARPCVVCLAAPACVLLFPVSCLLFLHCDHVSYLPANNLVFSWITQCCLFWFLLCDIYGPSVFRLALWASKALFHLKEIFNFPHRRSPLTPLQLNKFILCLKLLHDNHSQTILL